MHDQGWVQGWVNMSLCVSSKGAVPLLSPCPLACPHAHIAHANAHPIKRPPIKHTPAPGRPPTRQECGVRIIGIQPHGLAGSPYKLLPCVHPGGAEVNDRQITLLQAALGNHPQLGLALAHVQQLCIHRSLVAGSVSRRFNSHLRQVKNGV